ncbi:glucokinase [Haliea sp. E1-2-M8]|uniref:glucokinase n=1 Tax=Haliea sp. E1-2-M8 TaxID=3064706 RepID=UPI00351C887D
METSGVLVLPSSPYLFSDRGCTNARCAFDGVVADDIALSMEAMSGVYLSGGILPEILDIIESPLIRANCESNGRFSASCAEVPLAIVRADNPGLVSFSHASWCPRESI